MRFMAKVHWTNEARTRGKVLFLWRCDEHQMQARAGDPKNPPPPCPLCAGYHYQAKPA